MCDRGLEERKEGYEGIESLSSESSEHLSEHCTPSICCNVYNLCILYLHDPTSLVPCLLPPSLHIYHHRQLTGESIPLLFRRFSLIYRYFFWITSLACVLSLAKFHGFDLYCRPSSHFGQISWARSREMDTNKIDR